MLTADQLTADLVRQATSAGLDPWLRPRPGQRQLDVYFARRAAQRAIERYRATPDGLGLAPEHVRVAALIVRAWAEARACPREVDAIAAAGEVRGILRAAHYIGYGDTIEALHAVVWETMRTVRPDVLQIDALAERLAAEAWT